MQKNKNKQRRTTGEKTTRQRQKSAYFSAQYQFGEFNNQPKEFPCTESKEKGGEELSKK